MFVYSARVIVTHNKVVPLKHIESISFEESKEDEVVSALKDDSQIIVRTLSGDVLSFSTLELIENLNEFGHTISGVHHLKVRIALINKWLDIIMDDKS